MRKLLKSDTHIYKWTQRFNTSWVNNVFCFSFKHFWLSIPVRPKRTVLRPNTSLHYCKCTEARFRHVKKKQNENFGWRYIYIYIYIHPAITLFWHDCLACVQTQTQPHTHSPTQPWVTLVLQCITATSRSCQLTTARCPWHAYQEESEIDALVHVTSN